MVSRFMHQQGTGDTSSAARFNFWASTNSHKFAEVKSRTALRKEKHIQATTLRKLPFTEN